VDRNEFQQLLSALAVQASKPSLSLRKSVHTQE